jgi:hypothetical protein
MKTTKAVIAPVVRLLLVLSLFGSLAIHAAEEVKPLRTVQDCVRFMDSLGPLVMKQDSTNIAATFSRHYLEKMEPAKISAGIEKLAGVFNSVAGKITGWERGSVRQLGKSVLVLRYLEKHETGVMVWTLRFYRPNDEWRIDGAGMEGKDIEDLIKLIEPSEWTTPSIIEGRQQG